MGRAQRDPLTDGSVLLSKAQLAGWATFTEKAWLPFKRAWLARGLRRPPSPKQRDLLWSIADARPNDLGRWVREAPKNGPSTAIITYVLTQWHALAVAALDSEEVLKEAKRQKNILERVDDRKALKSLGDILKEAFG